MASRRDNCLALIEEIMRGAKSPSNLPIEWKLFGPLIPFRAAELSIAVTDGDRTYVSYRDIPIRIVEGDDDAFCWWIAVWVNSISWPVWA